MEAATSICDALEHDLRVSFDRRTVLLGAAVHDAGKILHPEEMTIGGNRHEVAGRDLLVGSGVPTTIARFCVTHAAWDSADCTIEDALVALADKLWKGKRHAALENHLVTRIAASTKQQPWEVFDRFDSICDSVAAAGSERLVRSVV